MWSLTVGSVPVGELEEVLNEAVSIAPTEQFSMEENGEQVAIAIGITGEIIDRGALGELDADAYVSVTMMGHANADYALAPEGEPQCLITVTVTRIHNPAASISTEPTPTPEPEPAPV